MIELRCDKKLHGVLFDGVVEIKCTSRFCGAGNGVVILHRFSVQTGELIETIKYRDPVKVN